MEALSVAGRVSPSGTRMDAGVNGAHGGGLAAGRAKSKRFEAKTVIRAQLTWTTERIALLKDLVNAGLSCGQIAREIGVSRNSVIGKVNRLGLSRFNNAGRPQGQTGIGRTRKSPTARRILRALWASPQLALAEAPAEDIGRCSLIELQEWHCRWPCGDPSSEEFGFCGNKPVAGLPYCSAHARMAYRPSPRNPFRTLRCLA